MIYGSTSNTSLMPTISANTRLDLLALGMSSPIVSRGEPEVFKRCEGVPSMYGCWSCVLNRADVALG
jgi:hypothetical protein